MRDLKAGALRLGATDTPARSWMPRILRDFSRLHPGVRVEMFVGNTAHVIERIVNREDDVAVVAAAMQHPDLVVEHVGIDPLVVIVPSHHAWRKRATIPLRALTGQPLIVREAGSSTRQLLEAQFDAYLVRPEIVMELGSHDAIIGAVEHEIGIALVPGSLLLPTGSPARRRALHVMRVRDVQLRHTVSVVYHAERTNFPLTQRFLEISRSRHGPTR
jgi:DNA-binding transcriptional LysR family regulator